MRPRLQEQIIEKAKEVVAGSARKDDDVRKLDEIINSKDFKEMKNPWNEIIAGACEGFSNVDGNILYAPHA